MKVRVLVWLLVLVVETCWGQVKLPPETHNAALRYWQAFSELKDPPPNKELQAEIENVLYGVSDWDEAKLGGIVAANENALGIMQRATKLPDCDWGLEYNRGPETSIAFVPRANVLGRLNTLQGIRQAEREQRQAAVDTWVAGVRFAQDVAKGGSLLFVLTAKGILLREMRSVTAEAKRGRLNAVQKQQLSSVFGTLPEDGLDWARAWELDEAGADMFFAEMQRSQKPASFFERLMGQSAPKDCMPPSAQQVRLYHAYMGNVTSALRLAPPAAKERFSELEGEKNNICETIRIAIPSAERLNESRMEVISTRAELLQALH